MLRWLGPRSSRVVQAAQLTEADWRRSDGLSFFLLVRHHHMASIADWRTSLTVSTYNSLPRAGFANGWTSPLRDGPPRHPLLDSGTISEFVTVEPDPKLRHLASLNVAETHAWDGHYRSNIYATGFTFRLALQQAAMERLVEKVRVGEFNWLGESTLCSFVVRIPVRRQFAFPEPRATAKPYSEGPFPTPLRAIARIAADWIEVAALDGARMQNEPGHAGPFNELFADAGPLRISFGPD